jgi:hypothetical protein
VHESKIASSTGAFVVQASAPARSVILSIAPFELRWSSGA